MCHILTYFFSFESLFNEFIHSLIWLNFNWLHNSKIIAVQNSSCFIIVFCKEFALSCHVVCRLIPFIKLFLSLWQKRMDERKKEKERKWKRERCRRCLMSALVKWKNLTISKTSFLVWSVSCRIPKPSRKTEVRFEEVEGDYRFSSLVVKILWDHCSWFGVCLCTNRCSRHETLSRVQTFVMTRVIILCEAETLLV